MDVVEQAVRPRDHGGHGLHDPLLIVIIGGEDGLNALGPHDPEVSHPKVADGQQRIDQIVR